MRFSIVTISYNIENSIERTLQSVLDQDYQNYEYILVDGNSCDNTKKIIEKYIPKFEQKHIPVKYSSEKDHGISDAFNKGIRKAEGEIVSIINGGDCLLPGTLKKIDQLMDEQTDILYGNIIWNDQEKGLRYIRKSKADLTKLMFDMNIMHPATFVKRKCYDMVGLFDLSYKYAMDQELLVRMQKNNRTFRYIDDAWVEMEAGGASDSQLKKVLKETCRIPEKYGVSKMVIGWNFLKKYFRTRAAHLYRKLKK